jgi:two-component system, OmpR family, response regulator
MRLLLVEDERRLAEWLARGLREEGLAVDVAESLAAARGLAEHGQHDVAILDVMLPDGSGLSLLREWRKAGRDLPVLVLTAKDLVDDKVNGLRAGADDYLTKPFAFAELLARVQALLRRRSAPPRQVLEFEDVRLDRDGRCAWRSGIPLDLSPKELALLEYLMLNPERVLSRGKIATHVWDAAYEARSNTIDVIVARLRRKLERKGAKRLIHSEHGTGYVLRGDAT